MKYLLATLILFMTMDTLTLFDFEKNTDIQNWRIVDDVVMGGRSSGSFSLSPEGYGVFEGCISLENNGGFSSVHYGFEKRQIKGYSKVIIRLKGDGKSYQLRIKEDADTYYSYIAPFATSGEWQEIEISLAEMYPSFRGRKLDLPNFSHSTIEELTFLIGNKKPEAFKLLIDTIKMK
jgi:NADH dehydrogenase [ubiquinone] 1 alpha subcomplex assembly factor 1